MFIEVYITVGDMEEAKKISTSLLSKELIACANIFPISSMYVWKEEVVEDTEYVILAKSTDDKFEHINKEVKDLHSYELPCIVFWQLEGDCNYLSWVQSSINTG